MPKLFISYRREDSAYPAHSICARLQSHFGKEAVFIDVDAIPLGVDFRKHVSDAVGQCHTLLAVMGKHWLESKQPDGGRRLDDPSDLVRIEIEAALTHGITVIPVLVDFASPPAESQLPDSLKPLVYLNAAQVRPGPDFSSDMERLVQGVGRLVPTETKARLSPGSASVPQLRLFLWGGRLLALLGLIGTVAAFFFADNIWTIVATDLVLIAGLAGMIQARRLRRRAERARRRRKRAVHKRLQESDLSEIPE